MNRFPASPPPGAAHAAAFARDGFFVIERAIDAAGLALLRAEADQGIAEEEARLARGEPLFVPVTVPGDRYVVTGRARANSALRALVTSELMAAICRVALGPDAWLYSETFVCKEPRNQRGWIWHQDASYLASVGLVGPPNLSVWIAIDEMTEENGTLEVIPWSVTGLKTLVAHDLSKPWDSEEVVSFGDHPPTRLPVPAGSAVVFSGVLPHASAPNRSTARRRAYLVQFSSWPVLKEGRPFQLAIPVLEGGVPRRG